MKFPVHYISQKEFEDAEPVYKIIIHNVSHNYLYFELKDRKYYVAYFSPIVKVGFMLLDKESYLLVGVDLKAVVICIKTGSILFSIGLSSFFKGFENTNELAFTIFSDVEDIVINKNGLSISQITPHQLEF